MNVEELRSALISLNIRSITSREQVLSLFKGYINWAVYNGKTSNENKIDKICNKNSDVEKSRTGSVYTR